MSTAIVSLAARTPVTELAVRSVQEASAAAAALVGAEAIPVDPVRIAVAYGSERHLRIDGAMPQAFAPLSGFFRTADGWVRTHGNYAHHAAVLRTVLALEESAGTEEAATAFSRTRAQEISSAITAAGGLCVTVAEEDPSVDARWRDSPAVVERRAGDAPVRALPGGPADAPLRGIRILDLTRVIAGPVATRTLALLGADVLRIDAPRLPEIPWQHLDTGHGKRLALLDLAADTDRARFDALLAEADIVALGYRPGALDMLGLSPTALAARHPGIIVLRHSAWGGAGSRGFDSLVQAASGIAWIESRDGDRPGALPVQALDHSAGYLLAAAALRLLARRAAEGGSWLAETSLRRIAAELLAGPRRESPEPPAEVHIDPHLQLFRVGGLDLTTAAPAVAYRGGPTAFAAPRPWGESTPEWLPR